jgi:glutathione S-transferase
MTENLVLYIGEKNISSWSMRGYLALAHKNLAFEERSISLVQDRERAERRRISPTGRVPVLHHDELVIPDSLAIIEYLEERFPPPRYPALWPAELERRAHARWLAAAMHSGFVSLRESMSFNLCFLPVPPAAKPAALVEAGEMLTLWEETLSRNTAAGPFLFGSFTAADIMYAPAVVRLTAFRVPASRRAAAYMSAVLEHGPVRRWLAEARALAPVEQD